MRYQTIKMSPVYHAQKTHLKSVIKILVNVGAAYENSVAGVDETD